MYEDLSRQSNWCQNILLPISNRRKPEQWIHAIRRDLGKGKVCSRYCKAEDFKTTLTHVVSLKLEVPSIFAWKRSSPRKQTPSTPHLTNRKQILIEKLQEGNLETVGTSIVISSARSFALKHLPPCQFTSTRRTRMHSINGTN